MILAFTALMEPVYKRWNTALPRLTASKAFYVFRVIRTFIVVNIGWFFDRCAHGADALRMIGSVFTDPRASQLADGGIYELGITEVDLRVLGIAVALLFVVSVLQERGANIRDWVVRRCLPVRWVILIGGVVCVLLLGVWGSGFNEASFIYYQF